MYLLSCWAKRTVDMRRFDSDGGDEVDVSEHHWLFDCDSRVVEGDRSGPGISVTACVIGLLDLLWVEEL